MRVKRKQLSRRIWENRWGYLFLVPVFTIMIIFKYYPTATAMIKSFYEWDGYRVSEFTGLRNYVRLFSDQVYLTSMKNAAILALAAVGKVLIFPLITAWLICRVRKRRWKEFYKYIFVVPMVVPQMVTIS